jgi:alpha-1,2-mannosyltransferase
MACALTALLVSPVSWDHHWVWLTPGLALVIDAGHRAARGARAWYALAAATWAVFAAWPDFWSAKAGLLQGGLIGYAPATAWAYGDNPAYAEYHWHGLQLLAGNLELLAGLALFTVLLAAARPSPTEIDRTGFLAGALGHPLTKGTFLSRGRGAGPPSRR